MQFDLKTGKSKIWRYWAIPELSPEAKNGKINPVSLLEELDVLLETAVKQEVKVVEEKVEEVKAKVKKATKKTDAPKKKAKKKADK